MRVPLRSSKKFMSLTGENIVIIDSDILELEFGKVRTVFSTLISITGTLPQADQVCAALNNQPNLCPPSSSHWCCIRTLDVGTHLQLSVQDINTFANFTLTPADGITNAYLIWRVTPS